MSDLNVMFGSRTALGLFTGSKNKDSKNNSHELFMFRPSLGNKAGLKRGWGGNKQWYFRGMLFPIPLYCIYCSTAGYTLEPLQPQCSCCVILVHPHTQKSNKGQSGGLLKQSLLV